MITSETIFQEILDKLVFLTGNKLLLITNFEEQLAAIRKNYTAAWNEYTNSLRSQSQPGPINSTLGGIYKSTNTILEQEICKDQIQGQYPYNFESLMKDTDSLKGASIIAYKNTFTILESFKKLIELESLRGCRFYQINIRRDMTQNLQFEKSIGLNNILQDGFILKLFLLSNDRIVILRQNAHGASRAGFQELNINRTTNAFLLKKDIKEVSTSENQLVFRNRLNSTWTIYMDSVQKAIEIRNLVNELR